MKSDHFISLASLIVMLPMTENIITQIACAQIIPDATLPINSIVTQQNNIHIISGGSQAGSNLFHSFSQFSVPTGDTAFFNNSLNIQNIITRVTGSSLSNLDGVLKANGTANLFLLNPNGIIFGPNAALNIGGSFLGTTANSIKFADGSEFNTLNPSTTPLLSINVPIGLQFGSNPGSILLQGAGHNLSVDPQTNLLNEDHRPAGLMVAPGKTLTLAGGDITLTGANLTAPSGRIELWSVSNSQLSLSLNNNGEIILNPQDTTTTYGNITLNSAASLEVSGNGSGNIHLQGNQVALNDGSILIANTLGSVSGGNISISAPQSFTVTGTTTDSNAISSGLIADVYPNATGNGANIIVQTANLQIADGGGIITNTLGLGNAGDLTINSPTIKISSTETINDAFPSLISSVTASGATGNAGNLTINTQNLQIIDGGAISDTTNSAGNAGNLTVTANNIQLSGESSNGNYRSGIYSLVDLDATGNGGNVTINTGNTGSLQIAGGAKISASVNGSGNGSNIIINSGTIDLTGRFVDLSSASGLDTEIGSLATGQGGNITINTQTLRLEDGAEISASNIGNSVGGTIAINANEIDLIGKSTEAITSTSVTETVNGPSPTNPVQVTTMSYPSGLFSQIGQDGTGQGGNIMVETNLLRIEGGAEVSASTISSGNAGNINVKAHDIELTGISPNGIFPGGLTTQVNPNATGKGGNLTIVTDLLHLTDGAAISVGTFGMGDGGSLIVNAKDVELSGVSPDGKSSSTLFAQVASTGTGKGGNLTIVSDRVAVQAGADLTAGTSGAGNAGTVTITSPYLEVSGISSNGNLNSRLSVASTGAGMAGNLILNVGKLIVQNGGIVNVSAGANSPGAGNLQVNANQINLDDNGSLNANTATGSQGNITLDAANIFLRHASNITTNATGTATGGNIGINSDNLVLLENSNITANAVKGQGGNIAIATQGIFQSPETNITASSEFGINGTVAIKTPDLDPSKGLVALTQKVVDVNSLITNSCQKARVSQFYFTGKGGLPSNPHQTLNDPAILVDLAAIAVSSATSQLQHNSQKVVHAHIPTQIIEAQGWMVDERGRIVLTTNPEGIVPHSFQLQLFNCHGS